MKHYVVYHNPDTMGYDHRQVAGFSIVTSKSVKNAVGSTIWVIAGRYTRRRYYLVQKFVAERAEADTRNPDMSIVSAAEGTRYEHEPLLNSLPWFKDFRRVMGNFGLGFQLIRDQRFIDALESVSIAATSQPKTSRRPGGVKPAAPDARPEPRPDIYRAISIRQPYAEQILQGVKKFEYRSQHTRIRERVWIYAGAQPAESLDDWEASGLKPEELPAGVIVGSVDITDSKWDEEKKCFAYSLKNPKRLTTPLHVSNQPQPVFWRPEIVE